MNAKLQSFVVVMGLVGVVIAGNGCASKVTHNEPTAPPVTNMSDLRWHDRRADCEPNLKPVLDRIVQQEGGQAWNGPYRLSELTTLLPPVLKMDAYDKWMASTYRPSELNYYVITKGAGYSVRTESGFASTIGGLPVCVVHLDAERQYRRFVFNTPGVDWRKIE